MDIRISTLHFETDPFLAAVRQQPYWIASSLCTVFYGYASTKFRTIRAPMFVGFLLFTGGMVGLATIQPSDDLSTWFFAGLAGAGFGSPLILVISGVQLSTPHHLIATATAATTCSRAVSTAAFTAIFMAAMESRLQHDIPSYITAQALQADVPKSSIPSYIKALTSHDVAALDHIRGVTPAAVRAGLATLKQAHADGIRVVYIIAAAFGAVACLMCFFLGDLSAAMNYGVDAPMEEIHGKHSPEHEAESGESKGEE